jgi:hypothetical protein
VWRGKELNVIPFQIEAKSKPVNQWSIYPLKARNFDSFGSWYGSHRHIGVDFSRGEGVQETLRTIDLGEDPQKRRAAKAAMAGAVQVVLDSLKPKKVNHDVRARATARAR